MNGRVLTVLAVVSLLGVETVCPTATNSTTSVDSASRPGSAVWSSKRSPMRRSTTGDT
ncbi:hypothetical protein [Halomarina oriensis]|uniref:Uncharacterized protein n=1 Tax=Halomarina oriensis TaxID=671145 RepID=A0A6B0GHG7_9EURY|nr:hypothetical protein [Halomarina oriensis]MWG33221.1 hypothetical protein [Halomarina oriensis]